MYIGGKLTCSVPGDCLQYEATSLEPDTVNKIKVVAFSDELGEGYSNKESFVVKTMRPLQNRRVFIWGNNASSESGLTDNLIEKNKQHFLKGSLTAPIEQP